MRKQGEKREELWGESVRLGEGDQLEFALLNFMKLNGNGGDYSSMHA